MSGEKCDYPNCTNKVYRIVEGRRSPVTLGREIDRIVVCKEHYDLLLFVDYIRHPVTY